MSTAVQAVRGMHDILPADVGYWQMLEETAAAVLHGYGYTEIRFPIVEKTELFLRSIGEVTDVVEKEMYAFVDRNGDGLALRPEGTAGCVRAVIEHGLLHENPVRRMWYHGPMFRHERPQKGRYRQFHQFGVEAYGLAGPDIDVELILLSRRILKQLGVSGQVRLEINTLGSIEARQAYRQRLVDYLSQHVDQLDDDSRRRLHTNPLRVLDSKNEGVKAVVAGAPNMLDSLDEASRAHFAMLCAMLDAAGVAYIVNPRLVRGLDYYSQTVFEWITDSLGAQGTVCAGGRYDGLVEFLGGKASHAVGFAMGVERLIAIMQEEGVVPEAEVPDVFVVAVGEPAQRRAMVLSELLRDQIPQIKLVSAGGGGSFKSQMKRADRSGARWAVLLGENEVEQGTAVVKPLRQGGDQIVVPQGELIAHLAASI